MIALDPDLLRAFVLIAEGHSFTSVAAMVGRTQSAVSMQVKRLEAILGEPVILRGRGGVPELTARGEYLLSRARQMLALNDEIIATFRTPAMTGNVRLGTPDDYALSFIPPVLKRFAQSHPAIEVDVICLPSQDLVAKMHAGELDIALISDGHEVHGWHTVPVWQGPLQWITSTRYAPERQNPLPLALAHGNGAWRNAAIAALDRIGRRYRIAYTAATQVGTHVPVLAGLAVTVSPLSWLPEGARALRPDENLPALPNFGISLMVSRIEEKVIAALAAHIIDSFRRDTAPANQPSLSAASV